MLGKHIPVDRWTPLLQLRNTKPYLNENIMVTRMTARDPSIMLVFGPLVIHESMSKQ